MKPLFPLHGEVPVVDWDPDSNPGSEDESWRVKVSLPAQTEIYSTNPDIWHLLGFDNEQVTSAYRAVGEEGVQKRVHGFLTDGVNYQGYREIVANGARFQDQSLLDELSAGMAAHDDFNKNLAHEMHFFVEFRDLADVYLTGEMETWRTS